MLRREREVQSLAPINVKRVYRVMRDHNLLLERRIKQPGVQRRHEGRIAVTTSYTRWCSDGFEFRCDDGAKLSVTFDLDCCEVSHLPPYHSDPFDRLLLAQAMLESMTLLTYDRQLARYGHPVLHI